MDYHAIDGAELLDMYTQAKIDAEWAVTHGQMISKEGIDALAAMRHELEQRLLKEHDRQIAKNWFSLGMDQPHAQSQGALDRQFEAIWRDPT